MLCAFGCDRALILAVCVTPVLQVADMDFLPKALQSVIANRNVLKWTYAYGYYLKNPQHKERFEYTQVSGSVVVTAAGGVESVVFTMNA